MQYLSDCAAVNKQMKKSPRAVANPWGPKTRECRAAFKTRAVYSSSDVGVGVGSALIKSSRVAFTNCSRLISFTVT